MTTEVHIGRQSLATVVGRSVQQQLRTVCFPPFGGAYVDHVDVAAQPIAYAPHPAGVSIRVPIEVYVVSRLDVLSAPNAVPAGAHSPAGRGALLMLFTMGSPTAATLRVVEVDLGPVGPVLGSAAAELKAAVVAAMGPGINLDLGAALKVLGKVQPTSSRIELADDAVAIRFDPTGPVRPRLRPGQEWGVHLDVPALEAFALSGVPNLPAVVPQVTSWHPVARWRPEGETPRIDVEFSGKANVPDPFSGDFTGVFRSRLRMAPTVQPQLRAYVDWDLRFNTGALSPGFVDDIVRLVVAIMVDPARFGAVRTGLWTFERDLMLPDIEFGPRVAGLATRFEWRSAIATADGMAIGGPVRPLPDPGTSTTEHGVRPFGKPHAVVYASQHGCVFGWAGREPDHDEFVVSASVGLVGCGSVCGAELLPPNTGLAPYLQDEEVSVETHTLGIRLSLAVAEQIVEPVRLLVRTSRGVRLIEVGKPPTGEEGEVTYIDDCLYADTYLIQLWAYEEWWTMWGPFPELWPLVGGPPRPPEPPNPLYDPDPLVDLPGIYVKVITVEGWEPGELVQVRTPGCTVDVTTDTHGNAVIPVIVPRVDQVGPMSLTRATRGATFGATAQTAVFVRYAALSAEGTGGRIAAHADGSATVTVDVPGGSESYYLVRGREPVRTSGGDSTAYRPAMPSNSLQISLEGLHSVVPVPGFDDQPVAIAVLDDGAQLVVNRLPDGSTRVAGTFTGLVPRLQVDGDWALAPAEKRIGVFRRSRV